MYSRMIVLLLLVITFMCGCSSSSVFKSYPAQVNPSIQFVSQGLTVDYGKAFGDKTECNDGVLYAMEEARLQQIQNLASNSLANYMIAINKIQEMDDKAVVTVSGGGAQVAAVTVNDNTIPYNPPGYERIVLRQLQSMNYLAKGDIEGASVEVRAANYAHRKAKEDHAKEINKAQNDIDEVKSDTDVSNFQGSYADMISAVGNIKSSFLNAYTFYYSGIVYELAGGFNDAYIDYKQALEIAPDNVYIAQDVLRLAKRLGMREDYKKFKNRYGNIQEETVVKGSGTLIVLFEDGFVKQKESIDIPIPYFGASVIVPVTCPIYSATRRNSQILSMKVSGQVMNSMPICSMTDLAIKSLQEDLPVILSRVVIRAFTKATLSKQASDSLGAFGSLAASIYNIVTESADRRSWLSLPDNVQLIKTKLASGEHELKFSVGTQFENHSVNIASGKITVVRVVNTDGKLYISTLW